MTRRGGRPGLTLVELVVVLLVMGIAAAVAVPALPAPGGSPALRAAASLAEAYTAARTTAATRGRPVSVTVEAATGAFWIVAGGVDAAAPETIRVGALPLSRGVRLVADGVRPTAVFDPYGRARGTRILFRRGDGFHAVQLDPWTGTAAIVR